MNVRSGKHGFTLIELVFVIILIALITTMAIPRISSTMGLNIRSNVLEVSGFLQTCYGQAILKHQKIRVSFDLDKGDYWAEIPVEKQTVPLITESTKLDEVLSTFQKAAEGNDESDEEKKKKEQAQFQKIETATLKPGSIASSLKITSVLFPGRDETIKGGVASFFISASGMNDEVVIYLSHSSDSTYSIIFPPMTGKPRVEKGEVDPTKI